MAAYQLVVAPAAKSDLTGIHQYGLLRWGKARSEQYLEAIKKQFWSLIEQPLMGVERPDLLPGVRSLAIESHTLFYRVTTDKIEIIRLLHGRQDPHRHLK